MNVASAVRLSVVALAAGAVSLGWSTPAQAQPAYPPHVSSVYASPVLHGGRASVAVVGDHLKPGITVRATRGKRFSTAPVSVNPEGTMGSGSVKVSKLLPSTAGRYTVNFSLRGASVEGSTSTTQTYTVGKEITIKSFDEVQKSYGLLISGKAAKKLRVTIKIEVGSKTYTKTVKTSSHGWFSYKFKKKTRGAYELSAKVAPNKKYFSDTVSLSYVRR